MREHSQTGEPVTKLESALLQDATSRRDIRRVWIDLGKRIGADALALVFDYIGGSKVHVPTRAEFFRGIAREIRDARIMILRGQGKSVAEIAIELGMRENHVNVVVSRTRSDHKRGGVC